MLLRFLFSILFTVFLARGQSQEILNHIVWIDAFEGDWSSISNPEMETDEDENILFGCTYLGYQDNFIVWRGDTILKVDNLLGRRVVLLAKLDKDGNILWHNLINAPGGMYLQELKVDYENNLIILLKSSLPFEAFQYNFGSGYNLIKLDPDGNYLWSQLISGADIPNPGHALSISCNNDIILGGSIGQIPYDSVVVEIIGLDTIFDYLLKYDTLMMNGQSFTADTHNIFITQLDPDGQIKWFKIIEHVGGLALSSIDANSQYGIAVLGNYFHEDWPIFNTVLPIDTIGYIHKANIFLATLDYEGNFKWIKNYFNNAYPDHATYDNFGNIIVLGHFSPSSSTYYQSDTIEEINDTGNLLLFKIDSSGNYLWGLNTGGSNTSSGGGYVVPNSEGDIYLAGPGLSNFLGRLLNKYTSQGQPLWSIFPSASWNRRSEDISLKHSGHLVLSGYYSGKFIIGNQSLNFNSSTYCNYLAKFEIEPNSNTPRPCDILLPVKEMKGYDLPITIYPNPAYGTIEINIQSHECPINISIFSVQGICIYNKSLHAVLPFNIDVSKWPVGKYIIKVETSDSTSTNSLVVIH